MAENHDVLSDRTLRYGRNINVIGFIVFAISFLQVDLAGANLFGISAPETSFWLVLLLILSYNVYVFFYQVFIEYEDWVRSFPTFVVNTRTTNGKTTHESSSTSHRISEWYFPLFLFYTEFFQRYIANRGEKKRVHFTLNTDDPRDTFSFKKDNDKLFEISNDNYFARRKTFRRFVKLEIGIPIAVILPVYGLILFGLTKAWLCY